MTVMDHYSESCLRQQDFFSNDTVNRLVEVSHADNKTIAIPFGLKGNLNFNKQLHRRGQPDVPILDDNGWHTVLCTGRQMLAIIRQPLANNHFPQSDFIASGNPLLRSWGWQRRRGISIDFRSEDAKVEDVLNAKGIRVDRGGPESWTEWNRHQQRHHSFYQDPETGASKRPAFANYEWHFNSGRRVIIANNQFAPRLDPASDNPRLKQWSDVTFLEWYYNQIRSNQQDGLASIAAPKFIIIPKITSDLSQVIIESVLDRADHYYDPWPGVTFSTSTEYSQALLACPNSKAVAFFLATHKRQFGEKYISEITIFEPANIVEEYPYLAFKIENVT
ncbi:hypothetical protein EJ08DRAFT_732083 [Tothia fuscella]|uniref:Uncharacterized protein n=1 Tax=Tothia fuscella TaxID=1048955 RepID=A0A9P4NVF2_9PEZI|nr:hypothetical protein EJ08DRAFT_732083 [Tothia fuscella]